MNKYHVWLAENYTRKVPFTTDWNYELLGDVLRAEFDEWFALREKEANAGVGKTRQLFKGEEIKKFMVQKHINLVNDPVTQGLKSVFKLELNTKKVIDKRAKDSLAARFEYTVKTLKDGTKVGPEGFMKFELIEGEEKSDINESENLQIQGDDIEYFIEEDSSRKEAPEEKVKESYICEECGKEFSSARALQGHSLHHKKVK